MTYPKMDDGRLVLLMDGLSRSIQRLRILGEEEFPPILATSELDLMERRLAQLRMILFTPSSFVTSQD